LSVRSPSRSAVGLTRPSAFFICLSVVPGILAPCTWLAQVSVYDLEPDAFRLAAELTEKDFESMLKVQHAIAAAERVRLWSQR
jgi:hypothetical protein